MRVVAYRNKKIKANMPEWAKLCALIAETAGYMHDLGKFNEEFQAKLIVAGFIKDNVRHEWLSMFLANYLIKGYSWSQSVKLVVENEEKFSDKTKSNLNTLIFKEQLKSADDALLFCIATHHKLPNKDGDSICSENHVNFNSKEENFENPKINISPSDELLELIQKNLQKIKEITAQLNNTNPTFWRAIAVFSRMALILADQSISAENHPANVDPNSDVKIAYANTHGKDRQLNQELSWHLKHVGLLAGKMVYHLLNLNLPSLSQPAVENICKPSKGRFVWQNIAANALSASSLKTNQPHLVLNIAGTGSGKTRMNLRAACALSVDSPVRVATALNLRTLTLQTGDAYHQQLNIGSDELACLIGDSLTQKLHESRSSNVDEDESEASLDVISDFEFNSPSWLSFYEKVNPKLNDVIGSPLLVSTIDFLIAAGEPHRKHHHILSCLRLIYSDLILDEIDSYEPRPFLAVLRLVIVAALFGKNVIASSATLSKPIASMLWRAYNHGIEMRGLLNNFPSSFVTTIIDDLAAPTIVNTKDEGEFTEKYAKHVQSVVLKLKNKPYRVPMLGRVEEKNKESWVKSIRKYAKLMHDYHGWLDPITGKKISFGLVRIANVRTAITVANDLANKIPNVKVVCYHANHFPMQRFHIEQRLDKLLTRKGKNPNEHILKDPEIRKILDNAEGDSVQFIVVATPVEEIGRDHDFDWGIIEPSSSQSIVQTAGRINRHRLVLVSEPNIVILQYCYREVLSNSKEKCVFIWPGLEKRYSDVTKEKSTHPSHDLSDLLDWGSLDQIDARVRFNSDIHDFAKYDDHAIEIQTKDYLKSMLTENHLWMALETYMETSLRDLQPTVSIYLKDINNADLFMVVTDNDEKFPEVKLFTTGRHKNDWLIKSDQELLNDIEEKNVDYKQAMTAKLPLYMKKDVTQALLVEENIRRHLSFGFYRTTKNDNE